MNIIEMYSCLKGGFCMRHEDMFLWNTIIDVVPDAVNKEFIYQTLSNQQYWKIEEIEILAKY